MCGGKRGDAFLGSRHRTGDEPRGIRVKPSGARQDPVVDVERCRPVLVDHRRQLVHPAAVVLLVVRADRKKGPPVPLQRPSGVFEPRLRDKDVHVGRRPAHRDGQPRRCIRRALQRKKGKIEIGKGATEPVQLPEQRACRFRAERPRAEQTVPQPCRMRRAVASRGGHRGNAAAQPRGFRFAQQLFPLEAGQSVEHARIAKAVEQQAGSRHGMYRSGVRASCCVPGAWCGARCSCPVRCYVPAASCGAVASSSNSARASSRLL